MIGEGCLRVKDTLLRGPEYILTVHGCLRTRYSEHGDLKTVPVLAEPHVRKFDVLIRQEGLQGG